MLFCKVPIKLKFKVKLKQQKLNVSCSYLTCVDLVLFLSRGLPLRTTEMMSWKVSPLLKIWAANSLPRLRKGRDVFLPSFFFSQILERALCRAF